MVGRKYEQITLPSIVQYYNFKGIAQSGKTNFLGGKTQAINTLPGSHDLPKYRNTTKITEYPCFHWLIWIYFVKV